MKAAAEPPPSPMLRHASHGLEDFMSFKNNDRHRRERTADEFRQHFRQRTKWTIDPTSRRMSRWDMTTMCCLIFTATVTPFEVCLGLETAGAAQTLASARGKLLALRETRKRPGRDEKILTAWNGLAIGGLARAARVTGQKDWLVAAQRAADRIRKQQNTPSTITTQSSEQNEFASLP